MRRLVRHFRQTGGGNSVGPGPSPDSLQDAPQTTQGIEESPEAGHADSEALHRAAALGKDQVVRQLLIDGHDVNVRNHQGQTPLHFAVQQGHEAVVQFLITFGADLEAMFRIPGALITPLLTAVHAQDPNMVRILLDRGARIDRETLNNAILTGNIDVVRLLLDRGAILAGENLHMAIVRGNEHLIPLLLSRGLFVDSKGSGLPDQTPLHTAAGEGNENAVDILLGWGASISASDDKGGTALHRAASDGRLHVVRLLLSKGADALATTRSGDFPIHMALRNEHKEVVLELLKHSGHTMTEVERSKLLLFTAGMGLLSMTQLLLVNGFDVDLTIPGGTTALDIASRFGRRKIVSLLISKGANPYVWGSHRKSSISWAIENGYHDIAQMIRGQTPLEELPPSPNTDVVAEMSDEAVFTMWEQVRHRTTIVNNPRPAGFPAQCHVCEDLDFRRGTMPNIAVTRTTHPLDIGARATRDGCPICLFLCLCLGVLPSTDTQDLLREWTSAQWCELRSVVDGGPLLIRWDLDTTAAVEVFLEPGTVAAWPLVGSARNIEGSLPTSGKRWKFIRSLIEDCTYNHVSCESRIGPLPTRVLDVGSEDTHPRLYISRGENVRYVALSHHWGGSNPVSTKTRTIDVMTQGIPIGMFPKTFQDAIIITRNVGIRYLWVDSLCIIQDSREDWEYESARMNAVFANCYLMISADVAENCHSGCFPKEADMPYSASLRFEGAGGRASTAYVRSTNLCNDLLGEVCHNLGEPSVRAQNRFGTISQGRSCIDTRGWTFQERILAPRILHFGKAEVGWECRYQRACECQVVSTQSDLDSRFFRQFIDLGLQGGVDKNHGRHLYWANIVNEFTQRNLTRPSDLLPALSGLASRMCSTAERDYICGMWKWNLPRFLMWSAAFGAHKRHVSYYVPSWSWASVIGRINYKGESIDVEERVTRGLLTDSFPVQRGHQYMQDDDGNCMEILDLQCVPAGINPFGPPKPASLTIRTSAALAKVQKIPDFPRFLQSTEFNKSAWDEYQVKLSAIINGEDEGSNLHATCEEDIAGDDIEIAVGDIVWLLYILDPPGVPDPESLSSRHPAGMLGDFDGMVVKAVPDESGTYQRVGIFRQDSLDGWTPYKQTREFRLI